MRVRRQHGERHVPRISGISRRLRHPLPVRRHVCSVSRRDTGKSRQLLDGRRPLPEETGTEFREDRPARRQAAADDAQVELERLQHVEPGVVAEEIALVGVEEVGHVAGDAEGRDEGDAGRVCQLCACCLGSEAESYQHPTPNSITSSRRRGRGTK